MKTSSPLRKAFGAILCSLNADVPSSSETQVHGHHFRQQSRVGLVTAKRYLRGESMKTLFGSGKMDTRF